MKPNDPAWKADPPKQCSHDFLMKQADVCVECARMILPDAESCGIDIEDTATSLMDLRGADLLALHARLTAQEEANEAADELLARDSESLEGLLDKFQELLDGFRE